MLREHDGGSPLHLYKLDIREPRLRRMLYGRVLNKYPVNEELEEQLSKPFYFRQKEHGTIVDVLFPKDTESPEVAAFKKGKIARFFQTEPIYHSRATKMIWMSRIMLQFNTYPIQPLPLLTPQTK